MSKQVFTDLEMNDLFTKQGYVLPSMVYEDEIRQLKNELGQYSANVDKKFYSSTDAADIHSNIRDVNPDITSLLTYKS
jgi:hypothetical protein